MPCARDVGGQTSSNNVGVQQLTGGGYGNGSDKEFGNSLAPISGDVG
ncbi:MAG: hypothetical protein SLRJCFUN_000886 [Candidatus Fervidibacter sp.]|jgi:hypothetical protein